MKKKTLLIKLIIKFQNAEKLNPKKILRLCTLEVSDNHI